MIYATIQIIIILVVSAVVCYFIHTSEYYISPSSRILRSILSGLVLAVTIVLIQKAYKEYKPKPDFYMNGKGYKITSTCIREHTVQFRYGYNILTKTYDYHYSPHSVCDSVRLDTTLFKLK